MNKINDRLYEKNRRLMANTLDIINCGCYETGEKQRFLKLSQNEMKEAIVCFPNDLAEFNVTNIGIHMGNDNWIGHAKTIFDCKNMDTVDLAREVFLSNSDIETNIKGKILVMNLANPIEPGGGVRTGGARSQEEDFCRNSTLLLSLESDSAKRYYDYNKSLNNNFSSDSIVISPNVEIFRNGKGELLEESFVVSVITCAAPLICEGYEGYTYDGYIEVFSQRIKRILKCAAHFKYRTLVLGAFGCGAFGNDAHLVSDLFKNAFDEMSKQYCFSRVEFSICSRLGNQYNFNEFYRNFGRND